MEREQIVSIGDICLLVRSLRCHKGKPARHPIVAAILRFRDMESLILGLLEKKAKERALPWTHGLGQKIAPVLG